MKLNSKIMFCSLLSAALAAGIAGCASEKQTQSQLQAQATVTRADAEKIALAKAPGGTIKEGELEKEKGRLIWSFDIGKEGTKDVTEVQVDARTGQIVSVENESAAKEAAEKKTDKD